MISGALAAVLGAGLLFGAVARGQDAPKDAPAAEKTAPAEEAAAPADAGKPSIDERINDAVAPYTDALSKVVFVSVWEKTVTDENGKPVMEEGEGGKMKPKKLDVPFVLLWLAGAAVFFTLFFRFVNIRGFGLALRTVRGKYSLPDDPGEITHFQALTSAVSGTVGLGNIAGVAIAISLGGPGAAFWMVVMGLLGMSTKFVECTLGVKYRHIDKEGKVHGGAMLYLTRGFAERGMGPLGKTMAVFFGVCCVGASFGGGNMFQINQATSQLINVTGGAGGWVDGNRWVFGVAIAVLVGMVIIGGISRIGKLTAKLVPAMTVIYIIGCFVVLGTHIDRVAETFALIFTHAFTGEAVGGGLVGTLLMGVRRAAFSNEAGIGSAPIAHAAVKTRYAASEGLVGLLEPFVDTVIICTMTALVVIVTGDYRDTGMDGVTITSHSFTSVMPSFGYVLSAAVILFALSTLITWSYYGLQAWKFLFGKGRRADITFKLIFCGVIIVGAAMSPKKVIDFSDAMLFSMSFANLAGVYVLLPVVRRELRKFMLFTKRVDSGESIDAADAHVRSRFPEPHHGKEHPYG
jgi:AGCS family alanine or glycine:cation symporter